MRKLVSYQRRKEAKRQILGIFSILRYRTFTKLFLYEKSGLCCLTLTFYLYSIFATYLIKIQFHPKILLNSPNICSIRAHTYPCENNFQILRNYLELIYYIYLLACPSSKTVLPRPVRVICIYTKYHSDYRHGQAI